MTRVEGHAWPAEALGDAIAALARHGGLTVTEATTSRPSSAVIANAQALAGWIGETSSVLGIEAEPVESSYPELERMLRGAAPALLGLPARTPTTGTAVATGRVQAAAPREFIALIGSDRRTVRLLAPDLTVHTIALEELRRALCIELEAPLVPETLAMLERAGVPSAQRERAAYGVLREQLSWQRIGSCWLLRPAPGAPFREGLRVIGAPMRLAMLVGAHALQYAFWLAGWWLIGRGAMQGRIDMGWIVAWVLMLGSIVPLRMLEAWLQGLLAIGVGALLKQRLLHGALSLEPDEIRHSGSGELLGHVIESEAIEAMALGGGFASIVAMVELALAVVVLALGAGGIVHALLLVVWTATALGLGWRIFRLRSSWTDRRLAITHDLVERMIGHRTRLAQERPERMHEEEDQALEGYSGESRRLDRATALLGAAIPRGWVLVGLLGLLPAIMSGASAESLAVGIGGLLLASMALSRLAQGLVGVAGAAISWRKVRHLFDAATRHRAPGAAALLAPAANGARANSSAGERANADSTVSAPASADSTASARDAHVDDAHFGSAPVLEASDLVFGYRDSAAPVLRGASLSIMPGERILLEGSSGGGKSTLAAILVGMRSPRSGLLTLKGLDRHAHGDERWRASVVSAPQFHDNHVLMGTFAFNLLMGRAWPPSPEDLEEADAICRELGLGELLERMPAGIMQNVGETGWQLSQGERSRLYIARALLQRADLIILDESFGALDPETLRTALGCVFRRAPALLVIAHP